MPSLSLLVVGLGNPGPKYQNTRHNVGFWVVEALADELNGTFERTEQALLAQTTYKNREIGLAKPLTYVNRSGDAVVSLCHRYDLALDQLLLVVDDLHLPVGTLRLRPDGGSGGHNGLAHVAQRLGTTDYPRLRIGIGSDFPEGEQVEYVLSPFTVEQESRIHEVIDEACGAVLTVVRDDLTTAMNRFN